MVSNLAIVLSGDHAPSPVMNTGTLSSAGKHALMPAKVAARPVARARDGSIPWGEAGVMR
jgi:hypothetical protein